MMCILFIQHGIQFPMTAREMKKYDVYIFLLQIPTIFRGYAMKKIIMKNELK